MAVVLAMVYAVLMWHEQDYLVRMEKQNLFLSTPLFLQQHADSLDGLLNYVACYFTQFFCHPWLGSLVFCCWCGLMMWLTARALRVSQRWSVLLLIPLAWVLVTAFSQGYQIYYSRHEGLLFRQVIALSAVMILVWVARIGLERILKRRLGIGWRLSLTATIMLNVCLVATTLATTYAQWYKDRIFYQEIRMADRMDWQAIIDEAGSVQGEPTRVIVALRNLALFKLGRAGDEMFRYPDGARKANAPVEVHLSQICGKILYLHYGMPNYCTRWCMEQGVKYGWTVDLLEYMTRGAILNREQTVADKYTDLLHHTLFHAREAEPELEEVRHLMGDEGFPGNDFGRAEMFLVSNLSRVETNDRQFASLAVLSAMQLKDARLFWRAFFQYVATQEEGAHMPRHFQEAAFLFGQTDQHVDISRMPFDQEVIASFEQFVQTGWNNRTYYSYYHKTDNMKFD